MSDTPEPAFADEPMPDEVPRVEDASEPEASSEEVAPEDAAEDILLDQAARAINGGVESMPDPALAPIAARIPRSGLDGDASDVGTVPDELSGRAETGPKRKGDWEYELSAHNVAVELKHIEAQVRALLEDRDPKRKRKLSGTHRWQELEDDLLALQFTGRLDDDSIRRLRTLVSRRHHLFHHLRYLASTRPTWNT